MSQWITNAEHLPAKNQTSLHPKTIKMAAYIDYIVETATIEKKTKCRRRPKRKPCQGYIETSFDSSRAIVWECPICGEGGTISNWEKAN